MAARNERPFFPHFDYGNLHSFTVPDPPGFALNPTKVWP